MYARFSARDLFGDLERFQRDVSSLFDVAPAARGTGRAGYPKVNVGLSPQAVEVYAFAPGLDPATVAVDLDRGVLSLSGERASSVAVEKVDGEAAASDDARARVHQQERFAGKFQRVVSLPDDIDPEQVSASYRDGVLRVTVQRRAAVQARRIDIH